MQPIVHPPVAVALPVDHTCTDGSASAEDQAVSAEPYTSKGFAAEDVVALWNALTAEFIAGEVKIIEHQSFVPTLQDAYPTSYVDGGRGRLGWPALDHRAIPPHGERPSGLFSLTTHDSDGWIVEENFYIGHTLLPRRAAEHVVGAPTDASSPRSPWAPADRKSLIAMESWSVAACALALAHPHDDDRQLLDHVAEIGVVPGERWDPTAFDPDVLDAIAEGMDAALAELMRAADGDDPPALSSRAAFDPDSFARALAALAARDVVSVT